MKKYKQVKTVYAVVSLSSNPRIYGHGVFLYEGPLPIQQSMAVSHSKSTDNLIRCAKALGAKQINEPTT